MLTFTQVLQVGIKCPSTPKHTFGTKDILKVYCGPGLFRLLSRNEPLLKTRKKERKTTKKLELKTLSQVGLSRET